MDKPIKEANGWKLYKGENLSDYTVVTPEGFKQYYKYYREEDFQRAIGRGWIWIEQEYYKSEIINSNIEMTKQKKQIQSNKYDLFLKSHNTTKKQVIDKLTPILKRAKEKFEECEQTLLKLQREKDFYVSYTMEGDTFGIYNDYLFISFTIDGVFCKFKID